MNNSVISMDLGGTNMRFAVVRSDGQVLATFRRTTPADGDLSVIASAIVDGYRRVLSIKKISKPIAIAAAVPTTSSLSGVLSKLPNLPVLDHFDLGGLLQREFDVPVVILNDATSATVGEHWLGAAKGTNNVVGITLGTGVGGGLIIGGVPYSGIDGSAGEIGHMCLDANGPACGCGSNGCLEQYVSGTALVRNAKLKRLECDTPKDVFEAARAGNERAVEIFEEAGSSLGVALASLINVFNPEKIVIGGGVASGWPMLKRSVYAEVERRTFSIPAERVKIVRAKLGDRAGVLGAARTAFLEVVATER